jgi:hypothetical protein
LTITRYLINLNSIVDGCWDRTSGVGEYGPA